MQLFPILLEGSLQPIASEELHQASNDRHLRAFQPRFRGNWGEEGLPAPVKYGAGTRNSVRSSGNLVIVLPDKFSTQTTPLMV